MSYLKSRKGNFETMALAIVTFMLVGIISTLASSMLVDVNGIIRSESVDMASERMERDIYGLAAMEDIKLQLDYGRLYRFHREDREYYISFTFNGKKSIAPFESPVPFVLHNPEDESRTRFFCLNKTSGSDVVHVYRGEC